MAEEFLTELENVLQPVVDAAWGQYCLCRDVLAKGFEKLGAKEREAVLSDLRNEDGVAVLYGVVDAAINILVMDGKKGGGMNAEDMELLEAAHDKAHRQILKWGCAVELWVVALPSEEMAPLWNSRSAVVKRENGAEELHGEARTHVASFLTGSGDFLAKAAELWARLYGIKTLFELDEGPGMEMRVIFSEVGAGVGAEGVISDDLCSKMTDWARRNIECEGDDDFIGLLRDLAGRLTEGAKLDASA